MLASCGSYPFYPSSAFSCSFFSAAGCRAGSPPQSASARSGSRPGRGCRRCPLPALAPPAAAPSRRGCGAGSRFRGFSIDVTLRLDALTLTMMAVITVVGFLIHLYSTEFMAEDGDFAAVLRLHEPLRRLDARPRPRRQPAPPLPRVGGGRAVQLPPHRLLVPRPRERRARRARPSSSRASATRRCSSGFALLFANLGTLNIQELLQRATAQWAAGSSLPLRRRAAAPGGRGRQVGAAPAPDLAPRRDGGPDPGERPHPCGDDGDRRRLPHRANARPLRPRAAGAARRRDHRARRPCSSRALARSPSATSSASSPTRR